MARQTYEEFNEKLKAIPDNVLIDMADAALGKLCKTGGKSFTMHVPPEITDVDMLLSESLRRLKEKTKPLPVSNAKKFIDSFYDNYGIEPIDSKGNANFTELGLIHFLENFASQIQSKPQNPYPDTEADGYVFCGKCGKMKTT